MVEILTKPKSTFIEKLSKRPIFFWVGLGFILVVAFIYVSLDFYHDNVKKEIKTTEERIQQAQSRIQSPENTQVVKFIDQAGLVKQVLGDHTYFSSFISLVESLIHQRVALDGIGIEGARNFFSIVGIAQSYSVLAKEIVALRAHPDIKGVDISQISQGPRGINFRLLVNTAPGIFRKSGLSVATTTPVIRQATSTRSSRP